jgi:hypothetical protein
VSGQRETYSEDLARVVVVVCDAAIAHPPLRHYWVETGVGDGPGTGSLAADEGVDGRAPVVLLFDLLISLPTHIEEHTTNGGGDEDHGDNNAARDGADVGAAAALRRGLFVDLCDDHRGTRHRFDGSICIVGAPWSALDRSVAFVDNEDGQAGIVDCPGSFATTYENALGEIKHTRSTGTKLTSF